MIYFFGFISALALTMVLIPPLMYAAERFRWLDVPGERKIHSQAVPRIGGLAMVIGVIMPVLMWLKLDSTVLALLIGIAVVFAFGLWDDLRNLTYKTKILGQLLGIGIVVFYGDIVVRHIPLGGYEPLPDYIAIPLTIAALLGITNAINLADGLDGLAGGTTLLSFGAIALLAAVVGGTVLAFIAVVVCGAILGFLRFNTYPARIFMGDGGSQLLGFTVGVLVIVLTQQVHTSLSPAVAVMLLGFPILDTVAVMAQRVRSGRSPFAADNNHLHHKLLWLGFDHYEAVFLIYLAQAGLVTGAFLLRYQSDVLIVGLYLGFCALTLGLFRLASLTHWRLGGAQEDRLSPLAAQVERLRRIGLLAKAPYYFVQLTVPALFVLVAAMATNVPVDFSVAAMALLGLYVIGWILPVGRGAMLERAVVYIAAAFVVYLSEAVPGLSGGYQVWINAYFVLLALMVVVGIRFGGEAQFQLTPLDFLVIFIVLLVPNLPDVTGDVEGLGASAAKLIVLFYAAELVFRCAAVRWDLLRLGTLLALGLLVSRGIPTPALPL